MTDQEVIELVNELDVREVPPIVQDDRTDGQRATHRYLVVGTDRFMSGWGGARGGTSVAAWACTSGDLRQVEAWVRGRSDMMRVRVVVDSPRRRYRAPRGAAHVHVYVVDAGHPAIGGGE